MKILVIKLYRWGDVLQSLPLVRALRRRFPDAQIDFAVNAGLAVAFEGMADVSRLLLLGAVDPAGLSVPWERFGDEAGLERALASGYDLVINLMPDPEPARLAWRVPAKLRAGAFLSAEGVRRRYGDLAVYNASCVLFRPLARLNLVDSFLLNCGLPVLEDADAWPSIPASPLAPGVFERCGLDAGRPLAILQPGASDFLRRWHPARFAEVADRLIDRGYQVAVHGTPAEASLYDAIVAHRAERRKARSSAAAPGVDPDLPVRVGGSGAVRSGAGSGAVDPDLRPLIGLSLRELRAVMREASLLVTNDTGPMHLAASLGVPTVAAFFTTVNPIETGAYRSGSISLMARLPCAPCNDARICPIDIACRAAVSVDAVMEAVSISESIHGRWLPFQAGTRGSSPGRIDAVDPAAFGGVQASIAVRDLPDRTLRQRRGPVFPQSVDEVLRELVAEVWLRIWHDDRTERSVSSLMVRRIDPALSEALAPALEALKSAASAWGLAAVQRQPVPAGAAGHPVLGPISGLDQALPTLLGMSPDQQGEPHTIVAGFAGSVADEAAALRRMLP